MVPRLIAGLLIVAGAVWLSLRVLDRSGAMAAPMQGVAQQGNVALGPPSSSSTLVCFRESGHSSGWLVLFTPYRIRMV